ncbi:MAG: phosphoenolpyruvate--protein phosphotransferase [Deltaproteobacteria bacterium RIFCSPLOWO2_12_FULL_43_16]|nr:MAG: phosphoenolpyruvate--protein phosphotransferase [Deltaproteobacteria bacterium GWA2_43_19]OGQ09992.1 MAG: phosphoenolpyruvate--protein phosphotransferase [Deltaproteobacteria bacterium RIFCSPHIGHO2_02_FULL_43_33]OGQ38854.1 MAG: phosphoenolpyruvate--protein phosphotransferase [Deltaproteobacteria bacterium RIFCSPLOWO2_01_FULL_42_9]OGQ58681.1 MAG: phosphoenolpyruvate--protein phosphotransferase [Deltaproteobacteria bacterium RIFCSPLOWO2_12_FULL_43_16]HBR16695.1 phosphoenolpyruvate--protei
MTDQTKTDIVLKGIGVSPGINIGRAYLVDGGVLETPAYCYLDSSYVPLEIKRFQNAVKDSKDQLLKVKNKLLKDGKGKEHIRIIDAHIMMLEDKMLIDDTIKTIKKEKVNAEWAIKIVMREIREFFDTIDDEYIRERGSDIDHICDRVLKNLMGKRHESISEIKEEVIIVAHDLSPTDTAQMVKGRVLGFLTDIGGKTSHTAIVARSLEIPAVVGLENITQKVNAGDTLIIDGTSGLIVINPSKKVIKDYGKKKGQYADYEKLLHHYRKLPAEMQDGRRIRIMGNIEMAEEIPSIMDHGAEGIGLYRTEFLYLNRKDLPTEDEHFNIYKSIVEKVTPHPTIIRTLDIGGDKFLSQMELAPEMNPAMGLRAIRFCLKEPDIFKTQLKGILRASVFGNIKVMFPMISGVEELRKAKAIMEEAKEELRKEGVAFNPKIFVGAMIEVPSAAIIADILAKEVDFFSIGTNDLLQYSLAIDRVNEHVAYLYEPLHPAALRIIKSIADAAHHAGIAVGVCGEMAGEPEYALILLGLGLDQLSMNALSILKVKKIIRSIQYSEVKKIAEAALTFSTAQEVEKFIQGEMVKRFPEEYS